MKLFSRINAFSRNVFGMRLFQFCSLILSAGNPYHVWAREGWAAAYGRVYLAFYDLRLFAIK